MGRRWTAAEVERLRELVMECWDPIGVHRIAALPDDGREAYWDEYDSYLPVIIGHLHRGDGADAIQATLSAFRTGEMGLPPAAQRDADAAAAILEWYRTCEEPQDRE